ncbi:Sec63-domain-containing protein [Tuber magnatum]|uniref:Sec63-domain-containing protein n=1 Tax=Tuber magnatum TaxID=42249 RepID=A0A317SMA2_9PEZI|nr:Sec63-domain-containing protein [Tuber magnatum]
MLTLPDQEPSPAFQWLGHLSRMDDALVHLLAFPGSHLPPSFEHGLDLPLHEEHVESFPIADDFFDELSRDDALSSLSTGDAKRSLSYDHSWLLAKCDAISTHWRSGITPVDLRESLLNLLGSTDHDQGLQSRLVDLLGLDELDFIMDLMAHRAELAPLGLPCPSQRPLSVPDSAPRLLTREERDQALRRSELEHKSFPLGPQLSQPPTSYPHVYRVHDAGNTLNSWGKKYKLPIGSQTADQNEYEEITIPVTKVGTVRAGERLIQIEDMDILCRNTFRKYKSLNRMQSLVYPVAYQTNENMLICAPTGAGKTDAAMLTILHTISMGCTPPPGVTPGDAPIYCDKDQFKIVYVAPMKALAAEIVEKLGNRLRWLGIEVRELTGDLHLTKAEIVRTQIIVTTPEKWDVVTRKSTGDTELVQKVRLLIIDEVHMLHDERGAVIESLVARTQRQVESTQSMIRIVGLSATLPNFVDVAMFLKVNPSQGLFYFDASFRPVPLEQHFLGVKGKPGTKLSNENLDKTSFEKVKEMLQRNHQVMVFVHSRKDTLKTARLFYQMAVDEMCLELFDNSGHDQYSQASKEMARSKGKELRELFKKGFGIHHAGMPRSDRNLMEKMFGEGLIKVLCCTATLAWGVNLPAAAVVIKGTQVYNAQKGSFMDLGILDVLQIFGRAGRPQFRQYGIGFICTTHDKLAHYLAAVTQQHPIESRFEERIVDNLNAEVALGTVTSIEEGIQWLGYSYMFVRWRKNPLVYGIEWQELLDDPQLYSRRKRLIVKAAQRLQQTQMIIFGEKTESLTPKNIGRIASDFYILNNSVEIFNSRMKPQATEADILSTLSLSGEFDNIQSRDTEGQELENLRRTVCPCQIGGAKDSPHTKVNILLQSYISKANLDDFALVSDSAYVAQNSARICRALFHIALNRRWGNLCQILLSICKSIESRIWSYQHPLAQFRLPPHIVQKLEELESSGHLTCTQIGDLVHNQKMGPQIFSLLANFPTLSVDTEIAPLNRDVLRIHLYLTPDFRWDNKIHGTSESYWIWVENSETFEIYHSEFFILSRKKLYDDHELNFTIPLSDPLPPQIYIRAVSDRWLGAETVTPISFRHLIRPDTEAIYTPLLNLQPLPITALKDERLEIIYGKKFQYFNPMQTQLFHSLYHTPSNILLGSPTGSGKTVACELAMWWAFRENPGSKVVYIAPMKALVRERVRDWNARLTAPMRLKLVELTGDNTPDTRTIQDADIIITTPEKWDGISRSWQTRKYVRLVSLVIIDEIHLLGGDRGPILEIIVSRMNYIASQTDRPVRIMGMSTACANAYDLANWLGVKDGLYNFRHSVRPVPLEIYIDGFPEQRGFCPLMQSMNRPAFLAIKTHSPRKPVIIFVASRRQTRLTAKDIIAFCGLEDNPRQFLHITEEELQGLLLRVKDQSLKEALQFGVGLHHAGLIESDRQLVEELFTYNRIQVLVATSTLAWGVNLPAHLVIVKGTQFFDAKTEGYKDMDLTDVLQMLGRAGRPQFDTSGVARIFTQDSKKSFYKYFLHTGFPVESSLHKVVDDHLGAEVSAGTISKKQDALDYLTWTFFFRRLHKNPTYYGLEIPPGEQDSVSAMEEANRYLVEMVDNSVLELSKSGCIIPHTNGDLESTPLGKIASYYYLSHKTIRNLIRSAKRQATTEDCLGWVCTATEYDELPVRHNEDLINVELSKALPFKAEKLGLPMWDPHVKAFLLVQAFISRIELPISDYITDQNSVLDQSIRILQASIDVLAELGYLSTTNTLITLMQSIKQARWPDDGALSLLPGIEPSTEKSLRENDTVAPLLPKDLASLSQLPDKDLRKLADLAGIPQAGFLLATSSIPQISISVATATTSALSATLTRQNAPQSRDFRIHAPKFPKPQTEGWFVLLGDLRKDELYALKRVGWPARGGDGRGKQSVRFSLGLPKDGALEGLDATLVVMSDGYPGLMQRTGVHLPTKQVVPGTWVENAEEGG